MAHLHFNSIEKIEENLVKGKVLGIHKRPDSYGITVMIVYDGFGMFNEEMIKNVTRQIMDHNMSIEIK